MTMAERQRFGFVGVVAVVVAVFLVAPLAILVVQSFTAEPYLHFPPPRFGVRWYEFILGSENWRAAAGRSVLVAAIVAPLAVVLGTGAALALDRGPARGRAALYAILISPMVLPHIVLALGMFRLALAARLDDTLFAFVLAHLTVSVPYVVVTVGASLQSLDRSLEEAAQSLGADTWNVFRHVILPRVGAGILAGFIFAFIESFDEFIVTFYLASFKLTLPLQIFATLTDQVEPSIAAASTLMLMVTALLTSLLLARGQVIAGGRRIH
ncbi:MAG: ABC transporter permease [Alphaproteobacteria bacterium]|nr:ABC transporter permease [Alphaproteobacteria bacterium]